MRSFFSVLCLILAGGSSLLAVDATPDEEKAMETVQRMGGTTELDEELPSGSRVAASFPSMTAIQITNLSKLSAIGALSTGDVTRVPESGFAALATLPHLRKLTLSKSMASNVAAKGLAECKDLRLLYIGNARVGDLGLDSLKKLSKLEVLDLSNNAAITDRGMAHLATMPKLEQLYLGGTAITDRGLEQLRPLEGLMRLHVTNTKISTPAAEKFEREMPNLRQVRR